MGKRIVAFVVALAMIAGALVWRYRDRSPQPDVPETTTAQTSDVETVICPPDLVDACRRAAANTGVTVTSQPVEATLDQTAPPPAWVTMSPLPEAAAFAAASPMTETPIASSKLSLVVLKDRSAALAERCGSPVDWVCLGEIAGSNWGDVGGKASWGTVRPGMSSTDSAVGAIGATAAVSAYFSGRSIDAADANFISWARQFARAVPASTLSAGTAAQTIQVRSSTLDIAVGVGAELAPANAARFDVVPVGGDTTVTVVVATADGAKVPDAFVDALRSDLTDTGWDSAQTTTSAVGVEQVRAALAAWEEMQ